MRIGQLVRIKDGRKGEIVDIFDDGSYDVLLADNTIFATRIVEPIIYEEVQKGNKQDADKLRYDLVSPDFEESVAEVLTFGANKYAPDNWKLVPNGKERYYAALKRHLSAWRKGEEVDADSGLSHLSHVACNVMFLMYFDKQEKQ